MQHRPWPAPAMESIQDRAHQQQERDVRRHRVSRESEDELPAAASEPRRMPGSQRQLPEMFLDAEVREAGRTWSWAPTETPPETTSTSPSASPVSSARRVASRVSGMDDAHDITRADASRASVRSSAELQS
ncbi:MAG: hypothetical protein R2878_12040 [Thermoleophilia bacterium]